MGRLEKFASNLRVTIERTVSPSMITADCGIEFRKQYHFTAR